ncbi:MAG: hypothetical protein HRT45_11840 [Bdellovibrionales bacterium]|nr:hypothetical protein [Bdellovibrionales bacterium]
MRTVSLLLMLISWSAVAFEGPSEVELSGAHPFLGDSHSSVYWFFSDYLAKNPGSEAEAKQLDSQQAQIEQENREAKPSEMLKDPLSGIYETSVSHALGSVARGHRLIGAALYNTCGMKVAHSGPQLHSTRLPKEDRDRITKAYKKDSYRSVNTARKCSEAQIKAHGPIPFQERSCYVIESLVIDYSGKKPKTLGYAEAIAGSAYIKLHKPPQDSKSQ